jgi:hypothetical protein
MHRKCDVESYLHPWSVAYFPGACGAMALSYAGLNRDDEMSGPSQVCCALVDMSSTHQQIEQEEQQNKLYP